MNLVQKGLTEKNEIISNYDKNLNYDIDLKTKTSTVFSPSLTLFYLYATNVMRSLAGSWFLIHLLSLVLHYYISVSFNSAVEVLVNQIRAIPSIINIKLLENYCFAACTKSGSLWCE